MITSLLVQAPEGFEDVVENFQSLVYGVVVPILMIVLGAIFVVIGIIRAAHISMADNEDSKKKAVKAMVWFLIGGVLCFVVAFTVPVLFNYLSSTFPVPTG
jgi:Na+/proline symporter